MPDTPAAFKDVRAFVVTGRRVEEREASLQLGNGQVSVTNPQGGITFGSLAYADITAAAYSRGKNPVWYPTLAGPPSDVDLPGGLFRSDRHWLALQSRTGYLIVRLNDDFRRVMETIGSRIGVGIDTLTPRGQ